VDFYASSNQNVSASARARRKLWLVSCLCLFFMLCEIGGGLYANSLAILSDAAHLLSDLASFLISIFALWLGERAPTSRLSFGFHRAEILGALASVILIWLLTGVLLYEAIQRLRSPQEIDGKIMFFVASAGLCVNIVMGLVLHQSGHSHSHGTLGGGDHGHSHAHGNTHKDGEEEEERHHEEENGREEEHGHSHSHGVAVTVAVNSYQNCSSSQAHSHASPHSHSHSAPSNSHSHSSPPSSSSSTSTSVRPVKSLKSKKKRSETPANINLSAAFIHVVGDALQSLGVMLAASLIWYDDRFQLADPLCTFLFSILVLLTTARLVKQSVGVLMEGAPDGIEPVQVEAALREIEGVVEVHDLHVWSLSVGKPSLSVHLLSDDDHDSSVLVLQNASAMLASRFNIHHATIQVEKMSDQIECNKHWA